MQENTEILLSTAYLPSIQYFSKLLSNVEVTIEAHETYQKQSYRNRCTIYTANGALDLSIPIIKPNGNSTKTRDVLIDHSDPWQKIHWKTIVSAYKHSSFFDLFEEELLPVFRHKEKYLLDWNNYLLNQLSLLTGCEFNFKYTDEYIDTPKINSIDLRNAIHPKPRLQQADDHFVPVSYFQVFSQKYGFISNLSFIDLLFNEGPQAIYICKKSFILKGIKADK